jgi:hypothetical protein
MLESVIMSVLLLIFLKWRSYCQRLKTALHLPSQTDYFPSSFIALLAQYLTAVTRIDPPHLLVLILDENQSFTICLPVLYLIVYILCSFVSLYLFHVLCMLAK